MAHGTKIGGTAYGISGGKTRISGTAYSISGGKTKIGGTAYSISFVTSIPVTVTGTGSSSNCYATINGVKVSGAGSYEVEQGSSIVFNVSSGRSARLEINRSTILSSTGSYTWEIPAGTRSVSIELSYTSAQGAHSYITVTTS